MKSQDKVNPKNWRTAKTKCQIGEIEAEVYVAVEYRYTDCLGREVYDIRTKLFGGVEAEDVVEDQLYNFCL